MRKIPLGKQDAQLLLADSQGTPMHIGGFGVYSLPPDAPEDYVGGLVARLRQQPVDSPPWNYRLAKQSMLKSTLAPAWEVTADENVAYHVVHHVLPAPGSERQLGELISWVHSQPLDMTRPLWEWHIIEGYANRRFIIYQKVHHALFDGTTGMRSANSWNSKTPDVPGHGPWTLSHGGALKDEQGKASDKSERSVLARFQERLQTSFERYRAMPEIVQAAARNIQAVLGNESGLVVPYTAPTCIVNGAMTRRRRVATQAFDLARVKAVAKASDATVNDVLLAIAGGALHRYLRGLKALPRKSLTAVVPVARQHDEAAQSGNNVSLMLATLATNVNDPFRRLMAVRKSTQAGKRHMSSMTTPAIDLYSTLMLLPGIVGLLTGHVLANVVVANVPGSRVRQFFHGARLEEGYPAPVLAVNMGLNITCTSYYNGLYVGLSACPDLLPHAQKLAVYMGDAFDELEKAVKHLAPSAADGAVAKPVPSAARKSGSARGSVV